MARYAVREAMMSDSNVASNENCQGAALEFRWYGNEASLLDGR